MSWITAMGDWLGGRTNIPATSRSFDPAAFIRVCEEDPEEARAMLAADQSALAREIEMTFEVYDARLEELATRVHALSPAEFKREAKKIREAQDGLRRALRRLEVSAKTAKELERELKLWQDRTNDAPLHADHPSFRSEIIASELRSRGLTVKEDVKVPAPEGERIFATPKSENAALWLTQMERSEPEEEETPPADQVHEPLTMPQVEYLLQAIREATHEAERWHAVPPEEQDEEAVLQVRQLRDLHAALKKIDREQGVSRDRIELAVWPREMR